MSNHAAQHLGSILGNLNAKHPVSVVEIQEGALNLTKAYIQTILEAEDQKLRSAEVPESKVGYKEPTGNGSESIKLDDNGGYVGVGKDTYYHSDRGQNSNPDNTENLAGSKQNYVESSTGKEAEGEKGEISESGMGAGDLPDYAHMVTHGGSTSTHDEPDAATMKKINAKPLNIDEYKNKNLASNPKKDAAKAIANIFKKVN